MGTRPAHFQVSARNINCEVSDWLKYSADWQPGRTLHDNDSKYTAIGSVPTSPSTAYAGRRMEAGGWGGKVEGGGGGGGGGGRGALGGGGGGRINNEKVFFNL